jgi:hypothetical protein
MYEHGNGVYIFSDLGGNVHLDDLESIKGIQWTRHWVCARSIL